MHAIKTKKINSQHIYFFIFIIPALLAYLLFFMYPFFQGIEYSFLDWNGIEAAIPQQMDVDKFELLVDKNIPVVYSADIYEKKIIPSFVDIDDKLFFNSCYTYNSSKKEYSLNIRYLKNNEEYSYDEMTKHLQILLEKINHFSILKKQEKDLILNSYEQLNSVYRLKKSVSVLKRNAIKRSFKKIGYENIKFVGFANFVKAFSDKKFSTVVSFTLFFTFFNVIFINVLALALALILDSGIRRSSMFRGMFFLPNVLSLIIVAYIWSFIFREGFPAIYNLTGWEIFSTNWVADFQKARWAVVITSVWQGMGYVMIIYLAGLQTIPHDILEVASIDGAGRVRKFLHIILPLLIPSLTICFFITLTNSLKSFEIMLALTDGMNDTTSFVLNVYHEAFRRERVGYSTAQAILLLIIIMSISTLQLSIMKKKETEM